MNQKNRENFLNFHFKFYFCESLDIEMANFGLIKTSLRLKYPIVLLQERCEIAQFKFGHPVHTQGVRSIKHSLRVTQGVRIS